MSTIKAKVEGLALKYRPITWSEVVGQETTISIFKGFIANKSYEFMNSLIVAGASGGGKTTSARIFARAINCQCKDLKKRPCNECSHCQLFLNGEYRDFMEVDGTTWAGKDDIAELKKIAKLNPSYKFEDGSYGYRVILLDEAHALSSKAWDILLKDLEEGKNRTLWIFATTELHNIRPAIRGRNPVFKIKPLSQAEVKDELVRITTAEEIEAPDKLLSDISRIYRGRTRDAINELDKYYKAYGHDLTEVEAVVVSPEDTVLEVLLKAINKSVISANVALDRAEILPTDIAPAITNILTAGYLLNDEDNSDLFDLGVNEDLIRDFKQSFNIKDFQKLINMTTSYDLNSLDRFKIYLMLVKELTSQKEQSSVVDQLVEEDKKKSDKKRATLKISRLNEREEEKEEEEALESKTASKKRLKKKVRRVKKKRTVTPKKKVTKQDEDMQQLGFTLTG